MAERSKEYAIVESGGKQFKVLRDRRIRVPSLPGEPGDAVTFERVIFACEGDRVTVGSPLLEGMRVTGEIVRHGRGKKVIVFKYKRRHRYRRKQGHRQNFTEVAITGFELSGEDRAGSGETDSVSDAARQGDEPEEVEELGSLQGEGEKRQAGPFVCEQCGRGFASERGLQQHRGKAHVV